MKLQVTVNKLNRRKSPVTDFADKSNVVEVVNSGFTFESVSQIENNLGVWHQGHDGHWAWEKGLSKSSFAPTLLDLQKQTFQWFDSLNIIHIWNTYNEKGSDAKIAILDTGYKIANSDISDKINTSKIFIDNVNYPGVDLVIDDQSNDCHGTRCASIIGAKNSKDWIIGIAPESEIIVGKISIDKEILDFNYILNGIKWAISESADIISISYAYEDLRDDQISQINQEIADLVSDRSVLIFAASGNSGNPQRTADLYPASFDNCVSVGASNAANEISHLTVLSDRTTIHAIGENIESYNTENVPTPDSGTSFATPIVAGITALAISYLKKKNNGKWAKKDLLEKIFTTGIKIGSTNKKIINPLNLFSNL